MEELKKWVIKYLADHSAQKIAEREGSILTKAVLELTKKMVLAGIFEPTSKMLKQELVS